MIIHRILLEFFQHLSKLLLCADLLTGLNKLVEEFGALVNFLDFFAALLLLAVGLFDVLLQEFWVRRGEYRG